MAFKSNVYSSYCFPLSLVRPKTFTITLPHPCPLTIQASSFLPYYLTIFPTVPIFFHVPVHSVLCLHVFPPLSSQSPYLTLILILSSFHSSSSFPSFLRRFVFKSRSLSSLSSPSPYSSKASLAITLPLHHPITISLPISYGFHPSNRLPFLVFALPPPSDITFMLSSSTRLLLFSPIQSCLCVRPVIYMRIDYSLNRFLMTYHSAPK